MFSLYNKSELHSFGEIVQPWRFWWMTPLDGFSRWDLSARNIRSVAVAAQAGRRRLQRLVHVPDPARGDRGDRPLAAAVHQVGRRRVRPARQGGRLPDGDLPGRRGLARAVDRQERRGRLAGLLPRAQPVRHRAAALAVPARRPADPRGPQPHDRPPGLDAVLHRRDPAPGPRGRAGRPAGAARDAADPARRGERAPQAVHRRPARGRPRGVPRGAPQEAAAQGPRHRRGARPALAADHRRPLADPAPAPGARAVAGVPRGRDPRHGRQVVPARVATTPRWCR